MLVRIWRTQRTHVRGHLANLPFICAGDDNVRLLFDRHLNPFGNRKLDGMGFSQGEIHDFALELRAIAYAHDVEIFFEALRNAVHRIRYESASKTV